MTYDFATSFIMNNTIDFDNFDLPLLYGYNYDKINRLVRADATVGDFVQVGANATVSRLIGDVNVTYDKIGNIKTLHRTAKNSASGTGVPYTTLQHWNYGYQNGTNRLQYANGVSGTVTRAYTYDANGNVLTDDSKNLTATEYGRAAYPFKLTMGNETEQYLYSVDDQRIYKRNEGYEQNPEEDYYLLDAMGKTIAILHTTVNGSNWEYFASGAEREVRIVPQGTKAISTNEASFYLYDHLGNTRVTYTPTFQNDPDLNVNFLKITVNSVLDYFPYGKVLRHLNANDERYLTTQHERDESTGLDYRGARYYDSDLGRFLSLDPLATKFPAWSAYNYVMGNPISLIDPDGREPKESNGDPLPPEILTKTFAKGFSELIEIVTKDTWYTDQIKEAFDPQQTFMDLMLGQVIYEEREIVNELRGEDAKSYSGRVVTISTAMADKRNATEENPLGIDVNTWDKNYIEHAVQPGQEIPDSVLNPGTDLNVLPSYPIDENRSIIYVMRVAIEYDV